MSGDEDGEADEQEPPDRAERHYNGDDSELKRDDNF